jgi:nucleoside diphosphate kinase
VDQQTYIMIKPDAVARGLVGSIVSRFEACGLTIERMEFGQVTPEEAAANYAEHEGKPFYPGLVEYITSGPVVKMVLRVPRPWRFAASSWERRTPATRYRARSAATSV